MVILGVTTDGVRRERWFVVELRRSTGSWLKTCGKLWAPWDDAYKENALRLGCGVGVCEREVNLCIVALRKIVCCIF